MQESQAQCYRLCYKLPWDRRELISVKFTDTWAESLTKMGDDVILNQHVMLGAAIEAPNLQKMSK